MSKLLCVYHGNCADGFTAAWVVRRALGEENVDFHAGVYQDAPPDVVGRPVVMVDFSYKRPVMEAIRNVARSVLVLDHHKTAEAELAGLSGVETVFDLSRSGAMIAWNHYFPNEPVPLLIAHVQDRDLWRFWIENTREIQACLFSYEYDFDTWDDLVQRCEYEPHRQEMIREGAAIERKHHKDIRELIKVVTRRMTIGGHRVLIANLPYTLTSDAGHLLAQREPFAACYWDTPEGRVFSLRSSSEGGLDVSEIAKQYGGGGHRNAAGFRVAFKDLAQFEVDS